MTPYTVTNNGKSKEIGYTDHDGTWNVRWKVNMT